LAKSTRPTTLTAHERDAEPRARPKRCDGCKRENSGERRPEGGRYRETLRERGSHQRRSQEAQADVAEGLHHEERLQSGLSRQPRESRCDVPTRQHSDRGEREDDLRREDEVRRHPSGLYPRGGKAA